MNPKLRLCDDVRLDIHYADHTPFGSPLSGLCNQLIYQTCKPALIPSDKPVMQNNPKERTAACFSALSGLFDRPGQLREDCRYPDDKLVTPAILEITIGEGKSIRLTDLQWSSLADSIQAIIAPNPGNISPELAKLRKELTAAGAMTEQPVVVKDRPGLTLVGHATVSIEHEDVRLLFDPFVIPPLFAEPYDLRQLWASELRPDAIFITHCHTDHYDLGTLLRFGAEIPIYVPVVERESLLAINMAARLAQLGFRNVRPVAWGEAVTIGPHRIFVEPFYGEQPTEGKVLHPEIRNMGNTYVVEHPGCRYALVADAGSDHLGSCIELGKSWRQRFGRIDVLLGGYRAWRMWPIQFPATSIGSYLLFVPEQQWDSAMHIMNDSEDLLDLAEVTGARWIVPYANGGAPWFWQHGLGHNPSVEKQHVYSADFDPDIRILINAHENRQRFTKPGELKLLRPGETCSFGNA